MSVQGPSPEQMKNLAYEAKKKVEKKQTNVESEKAGSVAAEKLGTQASTQKIASVPKESMQPSGEAKKRGGVFSRFTSKFVKTVKNAIEEYKQARAQKKTSAKKAPQISSTVVMRGSAKKVQKAEVKFTPAQEFGAKKTVLNDQKVKAAENKPSLTSLQPKQYSNNITRLKGIPLTINGEKIPSDFKIDEKALTYLFQDEVGSKDEIVRDLTDSFGLDQDVARTLADVRASGVKNPKLIQQKANSQVTSLRVLSALNGSLSLGRTSQQVEERANIFASGVGDPQHFSPLDEGGNVVNKDSLALLGMTKQAGVYASGPIQAQLGKVKSDIPLILKSSDQALEMNLTTTESGFRIESRFPTFEISQGFTDTVAKIDVRLEIEIDETTGEINIGVIRENLQLAEGIDPELAESLTGSLSQDLPHTI